MIVNYIQVAYALQITPADAKFMIFPHVERLKEEASGKRSYELLVISKKVNKNDFIESSLLNQVYKHPSPMLDSKDKIEYIITTLRTKIDNNLKKKIADDPSCLKKGKIAGKYLALTYILTEHQQAEINAILKRRHEEIRKSGYGFKSK